MELLGHTINAGHSWHFGEAFGLVFMIVATLVAVGVAVKVGK